MDDTIYRAVNTSLIYIERGGCYLMLHRTKKENDCNRDTWIGIGGKFERGESPEDCMLREAKEETGLTLTSYRYRGIVTFVSDRWEPEYMHLFTADGFTGTLRECDEGTLEWVPDGQVERLPIWAGDRVFLRLLRRSDLNIQQIITQVGYENTSYFYRLFHERYGQSPREYRNARQRRPHA